MLASCGGGGSSGSGSSSGPSPAQQVFTGLNDSNNDSSDESVEIDVFGDANLIVTVHITQGGFAISQHYTNFSAAIPNVHTFFDNEETWTGNMVLTSPADSNLFPDLSQTAAATNIDRDDTATYQGLAMGAMRVDGTRKLLFGGSAMEVDFANSDFDFAVAMAAVDNDEISDPDFTESDFEDLLESNLVVITAADIGFSADGALTGSPEFTIEAARTVGTGEPLEDQTAALEGGFRGPAGEILILSGSVTSNDDSLIWARSLAKNHRKI